MRFENPYYYPERIGNPKYFYGRTKEIKDIHLILTQSTPAFISIIGERRIGKSSLLYCLPHLFERVGGQPLSDCFFVYANMQFIIGGTDKDFFDELCFQIEYHISTPVDAEDSEERFEKYLKQLKEDKKRLVLLLDEFEIITESTNFDEDFFQSLIEMADKYPVSYIVASGKPLDHHCHDGIRSSDFVVQSMKRNEIYLGSLTEEETKDLITKPAESVGMSLESEDVDFVIYYAGYFPFFIQMFCYHLVREETKKEVERQFRREAEPHMKYIVQGALDEQEKNVLKKLAKSEALEPSDEVLNTLERKGYVIQREGRYRIFSELLAASLER